MIPAVLANDLAAIPMTKLLYVSRSPVPLNLGSLCLLHFVPFSVFIEMLKVSLIALANPLKDPCRRIQIPANYKINKLRSDQNLNLLL